MKRVIKSILLISLSSSGLSFAEITSDSWDVDTRYNYNRNSATYHDTTTKKSASINLTLDGDIDKSTNINGIFTLDKNDIDNADTLAFDNDDFVRQLYASHLTDDGTEIKIGKQTPNYDSKKAIQDLGIYGSFCNPLVKKICDGVLSLYVKKDIDENTKLEFLVGDIDTIQDSKGRQYATHIKHKRGVNEYHLTLSKLDSTTLYKFSSGQYSHTQTGNRESSRISLAVEIEDTGKDKYYIAHSRRVGDSNETTAVIDTLDLSNEMSSYATTSKFEDESLTLGKIVFFDELLMRVNINRSKWSAKYSNETINILLLTGSVKTINNIEFTLTGGDVHFEYPLESGRISSRHGYFVSNDRAIIGSQLHNRVEITYDLLKNLSSTLSYYSNNSSQHHANNLSFEITHAF
jgi:hypothetical protein